MPQEDRSMTGPRRSGRRRTYRIMLDRSVPRRFNPRPASRSPAQPSADRRLATHRGHQLQPMVSSYWPFGGTSTTKNAPKAQDRVAGHGSGVGVAFQRQGGPSPSHVEGVSGPGYGAHFGAVGRSVWLLCVAFAGHCRGWGCVSVPSAVPVQRRR